MASNLIDDLLLWCEEERASLQRQLDMINSGILETHERHGWSALTDTTAETKARIERSLTELKAVLARHLYPGTDEGPQ
jgi:hypothetical protein